MTLLQSIILGIIAGITDFLPVSLSGHITLFSNIMGAAGSVDMMFIIYLHIGTLISIIIVYFKPISRAFGEFLGIFGDMIVNAKVMFAGPKRGEEKRYRRISRNRYRKLCLLVLAALVPTVVIGVFAMRLSEGLIGNLLGSGIGLLITALLMLVASFSGQLYKGPQEARVFDGVIIGAFQGFSAIPGISRFGMTVSSSYLSAFSVKLTLLFSFLLAIPTVLGSFFYEGITKKTFVPAAGMTSALIAMAAAAVVGYFVLSAVKKFASARNSRYFSAYCCAIGLVSVILYYVL
ncbi:MAG: undecaprenyl-diphosphate phosphatase [Lachnospiraceae bacterium]|nr:undecaprenyl-diphosphate phosphatase [Lachnospiraceae bacterium]